MFSKLFKIFFKDHKKSETKRQHYADGYFEDITYTYIDNVRYIHNDYGPAIVYYNDKAIKLSESYLKFGAEYREDGPSYIEYYEDGSVKTEAWVNNGILHRDDGPATTTFWKNGNVFMEAWFEHGKRIRANDMPTTLCYWMYNSGVPFRHCWTDPEGNLDRDGKPALIEFDINGNFSSGEWYKNGKFIRTTV